MRRNKTKNKSYQQQEQQGKKNQKNVNKKREQKQQEQEPISTWNHMNISCLHSLNSGHCWKKCMIPYVADFKSELSTIAGIAWGKRWSKLPTSCWETGAGSPRSSSVSSVSFTPPWEYVRGGLDGWYQSVSKIDKTLGIYTLIKTRNYEDPYISYIYYIHIWKMDINGNIFKHTFETYEKNIEIWCMEKKIGTSCFSGLHPGLESLVPSHPITMKCPTTKTRCLKISPHAT